MAVNSGFIHNDTTRKRFTVDIIQSRSTGSRSKLRVILRHEDRQRSLHHKTGVLGSMIPSQNTLEHNAIVEIILRGGRLQCNNNSIEIEIIRLEGTDGSPCLPVDEQVLRLLGTTVPPSEAHWQFLQSAQTRQAHPGQHHHTSRDRKACPQPYDNNLDWQDSGGSRFQENDAQSQMHRAVLVLLKLEPA